MGVIASTAATIFRDHATAGVPASGAHQPPKTDIRALFGTLEARLPQQFDVATDVPGADLSGVETVLVAGIAFKYDAADTSTAHNGTTVLVDTGGRRYKLAQEVLTKAEVLALPQLSATSTGNLGAAIARDVPRTDLQFLRNAPSIAVWEPWALAPDQIPWETQAGAQAVITEAVIREMVRKEYAAGFRALYIKYPEIFGHWFTKPAFALWQDRDQVPGALTNGAYWNTFAPSYANDFDMVAVAIDECCKLGMNWLLGLGRVGLFTTLGYYQTGLGGYTGPAALSTAAQMQLAIDRTRQLHDDFCTRFAQYLPFCIGMSSGFEPDHMPTWKVFSAGVTTGSGAHPTVLERGIPWICTPGEFEELPALTADAATIAAFQADIALCNVDRWIVQDQVGAGVKITPDRNTFVPAGALAQLDDYFERWRRVVPNFGTIMEGWQMGEVPLTNLTLSATSGANITCTSEFNYFLPGHVGRYITGLANGNARIKTYNSALSVVLDTTVVANGAFADGAAFDSTSLPSGQWSINDGYAKPRPTDAARFAQQMEIHAKYSDEICWYGTSHYCVPDNLSVRLPQAMAGYGGAQFRTDAAALYADQKARHARALKRLRAERKRLPLVTRHEVAGLTLSGGTWSIIAGRYKPAEAWSVIVVKFRMTAHRGETGTGTNDVTIRLRINDTATGPSVITGGKNGLFSGEFTVAHQFPMDGAGEHTDAAFTFGASVTYTTGLGHPVITALEWEIEERAL